MDLTALQGVCRLRFRDPNQEVVTNASWTIYLNAAYHDVIDSSPFWPFKEVTSPTAVTVNALARSAALPANVTRVTACRNATDKIVMSRLDNRTTHLDLDPEGTATGAPSFYRLFGLTLQVFPLPTVNTVFELDYIAPPADLSSGTDVPVIPTTFHHVLVAGALKRAYTDDGNLNMAAAYAEEFDAMINRMTKELLGASRNESHPIITGTWWD